MDGAPIISLPGTEGAWPDRGRPLRVALVNNMPDLAFEETHRQFARLSSLSRYAVELRCFYVASVPRQRDPRAHPAGYLPVEVLIGTRPDALIVTGTEPNEPRLEDEPYWGELSALFEWAAEEVPAIQLSCLASHAALQFLDGIRRNRLSRKQTGVYEQHVHREHLLAEGLGTRLSFPHSRYNDVPLRALVEKGIRPLIASEASGWTVATRPTAAGTILLLQGHPEYTRTTLLKEYRRDVRRYLEGLAPDRPPVPVNYLDTVALEILNEFQSRSEAGRTRPEDFPFDTVVSHIEADWSEPADRLFRNWMEYAGRLAGLEEQARVGGTVFA
jgi:homoserine O-succinyltransferase/O-acetyltransferase